MAGKKREWNELLYQNKSYTDPISGVVYDLSHLSNMTTPLQYEFKDDEGKKHKGKIDVNVVFDNHCYTREINSGESVEILVSEEFAGKTQIRCFDLERYEFSKKLPWIIKNLSFKTCMESKISGKSIRLEDPEKTHPYKGVYIFLKARAYEDSKTLTLYVETSHKRNSTPRDVKSTPRRYMQILGDLVKNKWQFLI